MPDINVKSYIDQLRQALPYVPPLPVQKIRELHRKRDFGGIVKLIRSTMNVDVHLTLHWTSTPPKDMPNAPAWITLPKKMPYYGTAAFRELRLDLFIMRPFAETRPYNQFAMAVAHELSHVVLDSIEHPLRREEKAVDLTAMILGFSYIYLTAAHTVRVVGHNQYQRNQLGYLSEREVSAACGILVPQGMRVKRGLLNYARENIRLVVLLSVGLLIWGGVFVSREWKALEMNRPSSLRNAQPSCIERQRANRRGITSKQAETFCNCYSEEIGNPPTNVQEKIALVTRRCNHEAFGE